MQNHTAVSPLSGSKLFLTDSGFETTLIFHDGVVLPHFASIVLMRDADGRRRVERYLERHIEIARRAGTGFVIEGPTWRASGDWGAKLGLSREALTGLNRDSVVMSLDIRARHASPDLPMLVSGTLGPRGDGYSAAATMTANDARAYHSRQIDTLVSAGADMITAFTMTTDQEAIGIARAACDAGAPAAISFTLETDGRLPSGQTLQAAIESVDDATAGAVSHYMINCAHPEHFSGVLEPGAPWVRRIRGIRANASRRSHRELDASLDLDDGDPVELGGQYRSLIERHPQITVLGGCCGTDHRHVAAIARSCCGLR